MIFLQKGNSLAGAIMLFLSISVWGIPFLLSDAVKNNDIVASLQSAVVQEVAAAPIVENPKSEALNPKQILSTNNQTVDVQARAYVSVTMPSGQVIMEKNAAEALPVASLTKLMTALVVLEHYNLDQQITISGDAMTQEGEQGVLKRGQTLSVKNLLQVMLVESSNRAAYALADAMGIDNFVILMNERAEAMGLTSTHFVDSTGLEMESRSSAHDIAALAYYLFDQYPLFHQIVATKEVAIYQTDGTLHHIATTTNVLLGTRNIIGGKTGYTDAAKGCFMVIQKDATDQYRIHVVLGAEDRVKEMQTLINK